MEQPSAQPKFGGVSEAPKEEEENKCLGIRLVCATNPHIGACILPLYIYIRFSEHGRSYENILRC